MNISMKTFALRVIALLCLCASISYAQSTVVVSGHILTGGGATSSSGISILFELVNDNGQLCKIAGSGMIVPMSFSATQAQLAAGIAVIPNSSISCGSTLGASRWRFTVKSGGTGTRQCSVNITSATNLDSVSCLNSLPTTTVPATADQTYCRLDGSNCGLTGDITHNGHNDTGIGTSTAGQFNKSIWVDGTKYPVTQVGIQSAFTDACAVGNPTGTDVYLPVGTVVTVTNTTAQQFLITCPLQIHGPGVNAFWFIYGGSVPSNVPLFRVKPSVADNGWYSFDNFRVTSGSAVGGDVFFLDSTNAGINHLRIHDVAASGMATTSWFLNMSATVADRYFFGHLWDNQIEGGINLNSTSVSDSWLFEHNSFGAATGNVNPCLNATTESGSSHFTMFNNNGGCAGGFFISHGTTQPKILYNQIEQPAASTEANSAVIDLIGDTYTIDGAEIRGNNINQHAFATNGIRINAATNTKIAANVISVRPTTGVGIVLTGSSSGTFIDGTNEITGTGGGAVAMTNASGANPFCIPLSNATGLLPLQLCNDSAGGFQILTNNGKSWDFQNTSNLVTPAGVGVSFAGGTSGTTAAASEGAAGGTFTMLDINSGSVAKAQLTADFTLAANTNLQTIGALTFTTLANAQNLSFHCALGYSQATAAVSNQLGIQIATNAPTNAVVNSIVYTSNTVSQLGNLAGLASTTATGFATFTPSATATTFDAFIDGTVELPASAHTINFMASQSNSADLLTFKRGSYCQIF